MTEHTPGPWNDSGLSVTKFGKGIIARCPVPQDGGVFECSANADLIAAAPDLLEALQNMVSSSRGALGTRYTPVDEIVDKARAAIAKATGNLTFAKGTME